MSQSGRILIVDDDARGAEALAEYLRREGFAVQCAADGESGLAALAAQDFDAVVLDWQMPGMDGLEVCRRIRALPGERAHVAVLMFTGVKTELMERVIGLEVGADDYLLKTIERRELVARLRALLRRSRFGAQGASVRAPVLRFGTLEIDRDAREVRLDGRLVPLTTAQFELLRRLAEQPGKVFTRDELLERGAEVFDRTIDVQIGHIRSALGESGKKRIVTVRGAGYLFAKRQD